MNYPKQQDGWTLSGFITIKTDAATGKLSEKDVQSWTVTVTKGDIKVTYGRDQPGVGVDITGTVNYTTKAILLPRGTADDPNQFSLTGHRLGSNNVLWANYPVARGTQDGVYSSFYVNSNDRRERAWHESTQTLGGKQTWVIATAVPEPSAVVSAGVGFACVVLCAIVNQRRRVRGMIRPDHPEIK